MTGKKYNYFYRNGLTLFFTALFVVTLVAQAFTGWQLNNRHLEEKGGAALDFGTYLNSGHFISATFENFQSEFLQMALYVVLTVSLRQMGSAESKPLEGEEEVDKEPVATLDSPWPVRKGGWVLTLYSNSLSICFSLLFIVSWVLHFYGSWLNNNTENSLLHKPQQSVTQYISEAEFWFETFQNWQSEFLSILGIVFLTIYLRQKGSPESKPVDAAHMKTGK